jgi:hypothetical protein
MKMLFKFFVMIFSLMILFSCVKKEEHKKVIINKSISKKFQIVQSRKDSIKNKKLIKLEKNYAFDSYPINLYSGKLAKPNFKSNKLANDKYYIEFIVKGCRKNGVNYAGHYTIIQVSCGCMCEHFFMVDRITGKIYNDFKPRQDGCYGYLHTKKQSFNNRQFKCFC